MIQYIVAAGLGALIGSAQKGKKKYKKGGSVMKKDPATKREILRESDGIMDDADDLIRIADKKRLDRDDKMGIQTLADEMKFRAGNIYDTAQKKLAKGGTIKTMDGEVEVDKKSLSKARFKVLDDTDEILITLPNGATGVAQIYEDYEDAGGDGREYIRINDEMMYLDDITFAKGGTTSDKPKVTSISESLMKMDGEVVQWEDMDNARLMFGPAMNAQDVADALIDHDIFLYEYAPELYEGDMEDEAPILKDSVDIDDIVDAIEDHRKIKGDNSYNYSAPFVFDFKYVKTDDPYDEQLYFVREHRGGDVRGNYGQYMAFQLDSVEEHPLYGRISVYLETDKGDVTLDSESIEGYNYEVIKDETGTFEEYENVSADDIEEAFDFGKFKSDALNIFARGGRTKRRKMAQGGQIDKSTRNAFKFRLDRAKKHLDEADIILSRNGDHQGAYNYIVAAHIDGIGMKSMVKRLEGNFYQSTPAMKGFLDQFEDIITDLIIHIEDVKDNGRYNPDRALRRIGEAQRVLASVESEHEKKGRKKMAQGGLAIHFDDDYTHKDEIENLLMSKTYMRDNENLTDYGSSFYVYADDIGTSGVRDVYNLIVEEGYDDNVELEYFAKGGKTQGYNARLDESLAMRRGSKRTKKQGYKSRRHESEGMERSMGRRKYASVGTMDKGRRMMKQGGYVRPKNLALSEEHYQQLADAVDKVIDYYGEPNIKEFIEDNGIAGRSRIQFEATKRIWMEDGNPNLEKSGRLGIKHDPDWRTRTRMYTDDHFDSAMKSILKQRLGIKKFGSGGCTSCGKRGRKMARGGMIGDTEVQNLDDLEYLFHHINENLPQEQEGYDYDTYLLYFIDPAQGGKIDWEVEFYERDSRGFTSGLDMESGTADSKTQAYQEIAKSAKRMLREANLYRHILSVYPTYARGGKTQGKVEIMLTDDDNGLYSILHKGKFIEKDFDSLKEAEDWARENGFSIKKSYAHGGKTQGYNARLDESLSMRHGAGRKKEQGRKDRRDESEAMERSMRRRKYASVGTMDKGRRKMADGGMVEYLLYGVAKGKPDYMEKVLFVDDKPIRITEKLRDMASAKGFDRLRTSMVDLKIAPDFTKALNFKKGGKTKGRKKVSDFDKLAMKVAARYRAQGMSNKKAMEIGRGTAGKVARQQQAKKRKK